MTLPEGFIFTQASLQDYVDCPRRFQLRYLRRIAWPTPVAEPAEEVEQHLQRGTDFHRLVHQHLLGVPAQALTASIGDATLGAWWEAYLTAGPDLPPTRYPEVTISAPLAGYRLLAKLDVLASTPGAQLLIVDWKTNLRRPTRGWLEARLQTQVYRYLVATAGVRFNGGLAVVPEQVEMVYWFASFPAQPERFRYGRAEFERDGRRLEALIAEIALREPAADMEQAIDARPCRYCRYYSFCEREAGQRNLGEAEEELEGEAFGVDLDLEQIGEVEF